MKKLLLILLSTVALAACKDGGSSANAETPITEDLTKKQIEEKFNLPPEPDADINNSTILGVDINENKIRDDWERAIAFEYYKDPTRMNLHNKFAINHAEFTEAYDNGDSNLYESFDKIQSEIIDCTFYIYGENAISSTDLDKMATNTFDRMMYSLERDDDVSDVLGYGMHGLNNSQLSEVCPKYKK